MSREEHRATVDLSSGDRLGTFRVLGLLGAGGMGRVYRGRDERLKRDVALKVLPAEFATDAGRLARFQREAEILAALSHPNIAALYGLESTDGVPVLVMELVEGSTLATRIAGRTVALNTALDVARQIVDALDYAHEKNVLHRDLKPANIRITPDGVVKLLDFGLAKALDPTEPIGGGLSPADSPTITSPAVTVPGAILGTAAYMAPEQVRGRPLDRRADIWAFGCVLFEMLSGQRVFDGETVPDTLAAVLRGEPDWARLPDTVPGAVKALLRHCLATDPKARLRHIADARLLLSEPGAAAMPESAPVRPSRWRGLWIAAVAALAISAAAWSMFPVPDAAGPTAAVRRVTIQLPVAPSRGTTGGGSTLAIAPDGSALAFVTRRDGVNQLHLHHLADQSTTAVKAPSGAGQPVISPDGKAVSFITAGGIWRADVAGGEPELMCSSAEVDGFQGFRGGTWSEDGSVVYASTVGLLQVGRIGERCELVVPVDPAREARFLWPQVLPGNRGFLATVSGVSDDPDSASIVVVRGGESPSRTVLVRGARAGRLTTSGHLVFARGDQLLAAPFDLDGLRLTADPVVVLNDVAAGLFGGPTIAISDAGDLLYAPGPTPERHLAWVARDGQRTDAGAPRRAYQAELSLSPDGRRVAMPVGIGDHFAWLFTFETGTLTPLFTRNDSHGLVWSPDSRRVALPWYGHGLAIADLEASVDPDLVTGPVASLIPWTWSPDGAALLYSGASPAGGFDLMALNPGDRTSRLLLHSTQNVFQAQFSPDGRWLAYVSADAGRLEVYVSDYPALRLKTPVSTDGGTAPVWSRDGGELFYLRGTAMMASPRRAGDSITFGRPVELFDGVEATGIQAYSVAADGRFLLVEDADAPSTSRSQLTLVLNWFEELRRLAPRR